MKRLVSSAIELLRTSWAAFAAGDSESAIAWCRRARELDPANTDTLGTLGFLLHAAKKYDQASRVFSALTDLQPAEPTHWMNLGTAQRCDGKLDEAINAFTNAAIRGADTADFYYNVGLTHLERSDFESGRLMLAKAVALAPDDAEIRYRYALCCYERLVMEEALAALDEWEKLSGLNAEAIANIGMLLMNLGAPERAESALRRAVSAANSDPRPLLTLIQILERTNRLDEAAHLLAQLTEHPQAHTLGKEIKLIRAQLAQRMSDHEAACTIFAELLDDCAEPHLKHLLQFPLAKSLDGLHRHDEAMNILRAAHRSQIELLRLTSPASIARGAPTMVITRFGCDPEDVAAWKDSTAPALELSPIFIVAFPRSGTTLLEVTLDSHPLLASMDEQPFVQNALDDMISQGCSYPERLAALSGAQMATVRDRYWERVHRKVVLKPGQRLIDKNPLNILRLPAIRRLFPHAPVILAVRHPCDVMLSCFMQHFRTPEFALLCSHLPSLAIGFRRAFDFWYQQEQLLKPKSRELRYETFTAQFQTEIPILLDFLELPWDDAVLRPHQTARKKGYISTPSYSQVIEPVHKRAVGRWHSYERHLADVLPIIQPLLDRWGYEGLGSSNQQPPILREAVS